MTKKKLTKSRAGRPTKYQPKVVDKLIEIFKIGGTVEEACATAQIDKATYYNWLESYPEFSTEMVAAQHYADVAAKRLVTSSIVKNKNIENAKWWLEKRQFKNATGVQVDANKEGDIKVTIVDYKG